MTLSDLAKVMRELAEKIPYVASSTAEEAAMLGMTELVAITPVDTGKALSNWQVTLNDATALPRLPHVPSPRGQMLDNAWVHTVAPLITREANGPPTIAAAQAALAEKQPGDTIHIVNVLPYIQRLNDGSSTQAPAGFVDRVELIIENFVTTAGR